MKTALIVRGGWEGHSPVKATEVFIPDLEAAGFEVSVAEDLDVYLDADRLARTDLIVQCWSQGTLTPQQSAGLRAAVYAGTGFAGWHGGMVGTFTDDPAYLRMVGGLFLFHPDEFLTYDVVVEPGRASHPIVAGLPGFTVTTEQYWMLGDALNDVLATTVFTGEAAENGQSPVTMPVVWTRGWGAGKIFFSAIGHRVEDLEHPTVRELTGRGLAWAAR